MLKKKFDHREYFIIFLFSLIIIIFVIGILTSDYFEEVVESDEIKKTELKENLYCIDETKIHEVIGSSMSGIIELGDEIKLHYGYYDCNDIKRDDIVAVRYAGSDIPLIKFTKGLPKDIFMLKEQENYWHLIINNEIVVNSNNEPYRINQQGHRMLSLYERDFNNLIPQNTYLVLGNIVTGSTDSTRFGLIDQSNIIGKVELID